MLWTAQSRRGVAHGEYRGDRSVHRALDDFGPPERDEIAEYLLGVRARRQHEAVERRGIIVVVAGHLDPVSVSLERLDDVAVKLLRVRGYEEIIDFPARQGDAGGVQHLNFKSLDIHMEDIETAEVPPLEKPVDLELPLCGQRVDELAFEAVALEIALADRQAHGIRLDQDLRRARPRFFEPHRIVPPIRAELDHHGILAQLLYHLLEDIFLQGLMNPAIDDQYLAERAVIGGISRKWDAVAVVQKDFIALDDAGQRDPFDQQVQGIGNDFPETADQ